MIKKMKKIKMKKIILLKMAWKKILKQKKIILKRKK